MVAFTSDSEDIAGTEAANCRFFLASLFKRNGADDQSLVGEKLRGRLLPGICRQAEFFRAESRQELLAAPSGLSADLREKSARARLAGEINPVIQRIKIQRRGRGPHRSEDRQLQIE